MDATRLKQIEEIYHQALEIPPAKREAFINESYGADDNLRREVVSLLSFEKPFDKFIDTPPESLDAEMFAEKDQQIDFTDKEIGHYKIVKLLGKGGMGAVYLAADTKLDRRVALKILPPEFSQDKDRTSRFVREAKSASALNHPNIITIHEIGEEDQTLISNRHTTQAGMIMGTPNYMSPEQARGKDIDRQTDIFSFGVVLYEMLSGVAPFEGETVSDVIAAVLMKEPPTLRDIPDELAEIVGKTLQKNKGRRYQTAHSLLTDLKEFKQKLEINNRSEKFISPKFGDLQTLVLNAPITDVSKPKSSLSNLQSIAVLPFTNMSADAENEHFCDGLAEDLLIGLSKIEDLKVAARTSAFSFKGKNATASEIGEKLSVKNVLEGSVRRAGNRLRISVQLVNAAEGFQIWSERYDREMRDIFELQDEITLAVIDALKLKLLDTEKALVLQRYTENAEAYKHFLKRTLSRLQIHGGRLDARHRSFRKGNRNSAGLRSGLCRDGFRLGLSLVFRNFARRAGHSRMESRP